MTMITPTIATPVVLLICIAVSIQHHFCGMCCFASPRCIIMDNGAYGVMVSTWACGAHSEGSNPSRHPFLVFCVDIVEVEGNASFYKNLVFANKNNIL